MSEFHYLEESLKDFLANEQKDAHNSASSNAYKYNNLKITMNPERFSSAHFIVTLGISECVFSLDGGKKISGGLGVDERYVHRWLERANILENLTQKWKALTANSNDTTGEN